MNKHCEQIFLTVTAILKQEGQDVIHCSTSFQELSYMILQIRSVPRRMGYKWSCPPLR